MADAPHQTEMAETYPEEMVVDAETATEPRGMARRVLRFLLMFSVPVAVVVGGYFYWTYGSGTVSTDNAYVQQTKVSVGADMGGRIVDVYVQENQMVKKGDLLFRIDPEPYRLAISRADAEIAAAQVQVAELKTGVVVDQTGIEAARAALKFARDNYQRQKALFDRGFNTNAKIDQAQNQLLQAQAQLHSAQAGVAQSRSRLSTGSAVPGQLPDIALAEAKRKKAEYDLAHTEVRAPTSGVITQADRLQVGQQMVQGLPAVTIVSENDSWIEANFKETELEHMAVGQKASVTFDAYPELELKGHVSGIGAGTGSEFALLPAQNANGNWVKVTQRVPVRIALDGPPPRRLISGLSATVTVTVSDK